MDYEIYGYEPPYRNKNMMPGMLMGWAGAVADIPSGWHLCDGNAGTIDLRNKFIVGAGDAYDPADTGGSDSQVHNFTGDGHAHDIPNIWWKEITGAHISLNSPNTSQTEVTGTTDTADNRPQYYAFCWIQKL